MVVPKMEYSPNMEYRYIELAEDIFVTDFLCAKNICAWSDVLRNIHV